MLDLPEHVCGLAAEPFLFWPINCDLGSATTERAIISRPSQRFTELRDPLGGAAVELREYLSCLIFCQDEAETVVPKALLDHAPQRVLGRQSLRVWTR